MDDQELGTPLLCFIAYRSAENTIFGAMAEQGFDDITLAQGRLFARIDEGGSRLTRLAAAAQVTKQTASYIIDQLEEAGYVERVADPSDARARLVRPSARGEQARAAARKIEARVEAAWAAHLGTEQMAALRAGLTALRAITDPYQ